MSKASSYAVFGSWKKPCILKTVHLEVGKTQKILRYAEFFAFCLSQVFLEPIQTRASPGSGAPRGQRPRIPRPCCIFY